MNKYCLIRFDKKINHNVTLILTELMCTPECITKQINDMVITTFYSNHNIEICNKKLSKLGYKFLLHDITNIVNFDNIFNQLSLTKQPYEDCIENILLNKVRLCGTKYLTQQEHNFLQNRFK